MKIVSGGQTGVDRAALDTAIDLGFAHGGWVPNGRIAEDGIIAKNYHMAETPKLDPEQRTRWNVRDSDATLILVKRQLEGGTELTWHVANEIGRPVLLVDLLSTKDVYRLVEEVREWLMRNKPYALNIAGPRESEVKIYDDAKAFLKQALDIHDFDDATRLLVEQAYNNFRHWDQIRWLVPYWFATIVAGSFAVLATTNVNDPYPEYGFGGMAIFAALCLLLMLNLIRYHNDQIGNLTILTNHMKASAFVKAELTKGLPFSFRGLNVLKTATFWFMLIIFVIGLGSLVALFRCLA